MTQAATVAAGEVREVPALVQEQPAGERRHIPALDGIRGLAILVVMICHFTLHFRDADFVQRSGMSAAVRGIHHFLAYGWAGVDLFFVLSGFLITGILYDAKGGSHYFKSFYMRRVLRIFPLYYGMLIVLFVIAPLFARHGSGDPSKATATTDQAYWWLFAANIAVAMRGMEFYAARGVYWSLAVEEHFYFVWPAVVRFLSRWSLIGVCLVLMIGTLALRMWMTARGYGFHTLYVLTPCRLDSLLTGALIALMVRGAVPLRRFAWPSGVTLALAAPAMLYIMWVTPLGDHGRELAQTWGFTVQNMAFGALLLLAISLPAANAVPRFFSSRPMVFLGKYSYALYVFHFFLAGPVYSLLKDKRTGALTHYFAGQMLVAAVGIAVSCGAALTSWHLFEKHFLGLKRLFPYDKGNT